MASHSWCSTTHCTESPNCHMCKWY